MYELTTLALLRPAARQVDALCSRVARVFQAAGMAKGDAVALVMSNRPEYVCVWLGLSQLGVVTALINTNLRDAPLAFCINAASPKRVIVSDELAGGKRIAWTSLWTDNVYTARQRLSMLSDLARDRVEDSPVSL